MVDYSRPIRITESRVVISRPTTVSGITIDAVNADCHIFLRDGGAAGPIIWSGEADNASSSFSQTFIPPMRFYHAIYADFVGGTQSSATINVLEP